MDEFSSRKTPGGLFFTRKKSDLYLRDSSTDKDRNTLICSRVGCSSRMSSIQDNQTGVVDKPKTTKRPLYSSRHRKEATASFSRTPAVPGPRKSLDQSKKLPNAHDRPSSPAVVPCSRHGKEAIRRAELGSSSSSSSSLAFRNGNYGSRTGTSSSKYSLKSLKCNVLNDVDPSSASTSESSSSSELILGRKRTTGRKRIGEVESSLPTRGKKISGYLQLDERRNNDFHHGICISDSTRRRNLSITRNDGATSDVIRRSTTRARLNEQHNESRIQRTELPQSGITLDTNASIAEYLYPFRSTNLNGRRAPLGVGFGPPSTRREDSRQHNVDGIAEMLLAMDTIDQNDDLTYEQLLVLETNLFLRGVASHDQHRDMRLDIDNMSYEELLELEDRMGTVSTALSEEALTKCLMKSVYMAAIDGGTGTGDHIKCSICQEEYEDGNEVCRLVVCEHRYHVNCIQRWLQLKNWCPICKSPAAPSP